ncbi:PIN domain-like protein [Pleomassaria siparia CBS 279.74]|uniref:PIN domain-like protein n=1 Tax=Pleomassaria siparia CBS 279.74 TaxID=1314801 RepID=A0A6G1K9U8_9PLEO|nr:PIN domain-like protein [Pleomassaria siparia CBS 279.74]
MGVTGLWTVLQPCARPIKIETLNKKRLAVDASIWIYQFLKAVRDKEGNALRNSHIVGFFRRICKLLFFGIKPVFVFDGGAPALKRQTINNRKSRREGRREDAVKTASKLLVVQMQRAAAEEEEERNKKRKSAARHAREEPEEGIPENIVYAEEILQTDKERQTNRKFRKKDQYHLPELGASMAEMGAANDPRIMSLEELEEYARDFDRGEDINVYDFSKIDFDSPFFVSLPASDRYNILNAARLRSRLRLGYSKDQLDVMFPDRMAFSRFQIDRVRERNDLTQRLMNLNGMVDDSMFGPNSTNRVAGEKGREYVLVKNDGVEGGWALGVVTNKDEGHINKPIDVDRLPEPDADIDAEEWEEEDEFEDVPIEGLNRLPKPKPGLSAEDKEGREFIANELEKRRKKFYNSRKRNPNPNPNPRPRKRKPVNQDPDSLFLAEDNEVEMEDEDWESVPAGDADDLFEEPVGETVDEEEQQLQQAIALSLQTDGQEPIGESEDDEDIYREVFQQERAQEATPFARAGGSGLAAIARTANQQSRKLVPTKPFQDSDSDDDMDLQAALAESRKSKRATTTMPKASNNTPQPVPKVAPKSKTASGFDGPLPFEKLSLGNSILGKKKMQKIEEDNAGGFEKDLGPAEKKSAEPLPPWFAGERDIQEDLSVQREDERKDWEEARKADEAARFQYQPLPGLRKVDTREVIDLEAPPTQEKSTDAIAIDSSEDEEDVEMEDVLTQPSKPTMGDVAEKIRAEPPPPSPEVQKSLQPPDPATKVNNPFADDSDDEPIDWSESEAEEEKSARLVSKSMQKAERVVTSPSKSPSPEFVDVPMQEATAPVPQLAKSPSPEFEDVPIAMGPPSRRPRRSPSPGILQGPDDLLIPVEPYSQVVEDEDAAAAAAAAALVENSDNDSDQYSDAEDAELFASLAAEAEEHSRFAQELNNNTTAPIDFDQELKQLRAQQKKDRRDADEVTQTMISECQHLLRLFGLPYVTAPMEAEAQCAELVHLGLVDGIVTDDSDTFLFGGTRVYKNMFNAAKYVECYLANDFQTEFSLTREKLIAIAQLLGSDYTTGIPGIGPVTALEILSEFSDLDTFKDWWAGVQGGTVSKEEDAKASPFRRRFRRSQASKLFLPTNFPDPRVAEAYRVPEVDKDPQPFQWGVPDLDALRTFLSSQIGWSWERTDEVLVPVIKDMNRREKEGTQSNITRYFDGAVGAGAFAPRVRDGGQGGGPSGKRKGKGAAGKRLGAALTRLAEKDRESNEGEKGRADEEDEAAVDAQPAPTSAPPPTRKKRKVAKKATVAEPQHDAETDDDDDDDDDEDDLYAEPRARKQTRKPRKGNNKAAG